MLSIGEAAAAAAIPPPSGSSNDAPRSTLLSQSVHLQQTRVRSNDREQQWARLGVGVDDGKGEQEFGDDGDLFDLDLDLDNAGRLQLRRLLRRGRRAPRPARCRRWDLFRSRRSGLEEGARAEVPRPRREPARRSEGRGPALALISFFALLRFAPV